MEDKKATIKDKVSPDLLVSPHIVSELFHVVMGEWQPDSSQLEQLVVHLIECEYCRTALIVLLSADQEYEMTSSFTETPARNLLTQIVTIHHEIAVQDYEHMGAYAEAIVAEGRKEADKRFLVLAEHVRKCSSCKSWLEETLAFLNKSEKSD
jgi:predicted anti-sigma-YlaC factor YlaD